MLEALKEYAMRVIIKYITVSLLCPAIIGCASRTNSWNLPPSHPANPMAEVPRISVPHNPFKNERHNGFSPLDSSGSSDRHSHSEAIDSHSRPHKHHKMKPAQPNDGRGKVFKESAQ